MNKVYTVRGKSFLKIERYNEAVSDFSKAIAAKPEADLYYYRGYAYQMKEDLSSAGRDFDAAIELDDSHESALKNKALISFDLENYEDASKEYKKLMRLYPDNFQYPMNRGIANLKLKQYDMAVDDFSKAIDINKDLAEAYFNRSNAYAQLELYSKACKDMRKSAKLGYDPAFDYIQSLCQD